MEISFTSLIIINCLVLFATALSLASVVLIRQYNKRQKLYAEQFEKLENFLKTGLEANDAVTQRLAEATRRIAWLETRVRQPKTNDEESSESVVVAPVKSTIAERRQRVLKLADRGQDSSTIAATLGMPAGEVELIINLNRVIA